MNRMASQKDMFDENSQANDAEGEPEGPEGARGGVYENFGEEEANDYDPKTKRTVKFKEGELGIVIDHLENNLQNLTGHIKSNEYRRGRRAAWKRLVTDVNRWNSDNKTGVIRSGASIKTKIDNLKYRSKFDHDTEVIKTQGIDILFEMYILN